MGDFLSKLLSGGESDEGNSVVAAARHDDDDEVKQYVDPDFHDRLRRDWPEDGAQLHSGGWKMTKLLMGDMQSWLQTMNVDNSDAETLDLCCGEGSTPVFYAQERGWRCIGIDISRTAIDAAKRAAEAAGVADKVSFVAGSAFELPFEANRFHVVYGQDPDALSLSGRLSCFQHCMRVLKPNGRLAFHHHWIPGHGWEREDLEAYRAASGSDEVTADDYERDLRTAGFELEVCEPVTELAKAHLSAQLRNMKDRVAREGGEVQQWLQVTVEYLDKGFPFGIRVVARKK